MRNQICRVQMVVPTLLLLQLFWLTFSVADVLAQPQLDVSSSTSVTLSGFVYNRSLQTYDQLATIKNSSNQQINGPVYLVLSQLSPGVSLANASGVTDAGLPYVTGLADGNLAPGKAITNLVLRFKNTSGRAPKYTTSVLAFSVGQTTAKTPLVGVHVSELTQALEASGQWRYTSWHYLVAAESLKEALRSDGIPFVEVSDSDIAQGKLQNSDGSPRYPILISLAAEAVGSNEIVPLREYVAAGGFLMVGSSSMTRNPDGSDRGDFALAAEMGLHQTYSSLTADNNWDWYQNQHLTKTISHRLTSHIPEGQLSWNLPFTAEEIPWGPYPLDAPRNPHWAYSVTATGATVLANGDQGIPYLAVNPYGKGEIIFHGPIQPILGHGITAPSTYAYLIYRKAIEWAFESNSLPISKLSPWRYGYDAALLIRHDGEVFLDQIKAIEGSASFEKGIGAKGDYYFCTGALRTYAGTDKNNIVTSLQRAVTLYGATIGSHNGGYGFPNLLPNDYHYFHWGPDEVLDLVSLPAGYVSGKTYAADSIFTSFVDIQGWLPGLDNGRPGCGVAQNCPKTWVAPYFNATREGSKEALQLVGTITGGEEKVGPYPHFILSYQSPGKRFPQVSLPPSDWFVGATIPSAIEMGFPSAESLHAAIDFYVNEGLLVNFYGHQPSNNGGLEQEYVTYSMAKPRIWSSNAVEMYDWWVSRSKVAVAPTIESTGSSYSIDISVSGATDPDTTVEIALPQSSAISGLSVYLNNQPASTTDYRSTGKGLKIRVGNQAPKVKVQYSVVGAALPL